MGASYAFYGLHAPASARDHYALSYAQFVLLLVRAVQELSQQVETLQSERAADHAALLTVRAQLTRLFGKAGLRAAARH